MSFCLDTYLQQSDNYEIHASKAGFKDCAMIIRFKADDLVYEAAQKTKGVINANGDEATYGVEHNVDIYYNPQNGLFYLTDVYTDNVERSVTHRFLFKADELPYIMMGYVHYHPGVSDISLIFNENDVYVADQLKCAAHIVNANKKTKSYYEMLPSDKRDIIFPYGGY